MSAAGGGRLYCQDKDTADDEDILSRPMPSGSGGEKLLIPRVYRGYRMNIRQLLS